MLFKVKAAFYFSSLYLGFYLQNTVKTLLKSKKSKINVPTQKTLFHSGLLELNVRRQMVGTRPVQANH